MARRFIIILLVLCTLCLLPGCWDKKEAEDLGIMSGIGIEQGSEGQIRVILQTINPVALTKGSGGRGITYEKAYRNGVTEGNTVYDAIKKNETKSARHYFLGHTRLILVSEDFARQRGLREIFDGLERDPALRFTSWLLIGRGNLVEILDVPGRIATTPSDRITEIAQLMVSSSSLAPLRIGEFSRLMQSESTQPFTAVVESAPNPSLPSEEGFGISGGTVPEPSHEIKAIGTAVFRQDKMVGFLDEKESRGLLWVRGEVKGGSIIFPCPDRTEKLISTEVVKSKTSLLPEVKDGSLSMIVKIEAETRLEETQASVELTKIKSIKRLESAQAEKIGNEITSALQKAQGEYQVDVFGFGEAVHRRYPQEWKELQKTWPEQFPAVPVQLQIETKIVNTGMTNNSAELTQR